MPVDVDTEIMHRDVHPAELSMPDGSVLKPVRCFVTSERLIAWQATPERRLVKVLDLALTDDAYVEPNRGTLGQGRLEVRTEMGTVWVNSGRGCGCGSVLKAMAQPVPWTRR